MRGVRKSGSGPRTLLVCDPRGEDATPTFNEQTQGTNIFEQ